MDDIIRLVDRYKLWRQPLYKWDSWVVNRHRQDKIIDPWCQRIVQNCQGRTMAFNCGGMFFTDFINDLTVVEFRPCPIKSITGMIYMSHGIKFYDEFDNIIMINPTSLKFNSSIADFLNNPGISFPGKKPKILDWLKTPSKIFLSFSDWWIYYDRLKYTAEDMMQMQIEELSKIGITCEYLEIGQIDDDIENGNIKCILQFNNRV